ncbi:MAG: type II toxin-antitoxin system PemK/MazF family toxin [Gemmatimonadaceae bacterium]
MAYIGLVRRWDVFWADLEPAVGSEQGGERRPVLVVSNDGFNAQMNTVTVLPLTKLEGKRRKPYTFEVVLAPGTVGEVLTSIVMPHQIRTISKMRLLEPLTRIADEAKQEEIENRLLEHLDIAFEAEAELPEEE